MEVTEEQNPKERFKLYRLCDCPICEGSGKQDGARCKECRGEGKVRQLVATCDEESLGGAIITLGREGEWKDCAFGLLDTMGEVNEKWLVKPWLPSARNVSDAARTLGKIGGPKGYAAGIGAQRNKKTK